jgi:AAA15 family ATPase/GTPase
MYTAIKIKDYKCFTKDLDYQGFNNIKPINVIIGKNNSGKSKLLEALELIAQNNGDLPIYAQFQKILDEEELKKIFRQDTRSITSSISCIGNDWDDIGSYLVGKKILLQQYGQKLQLIDININDFALPKTDKYPPEGVEDAVETVMPQCELWTDNVMVA